MSSWQFAAMVMVTGLASGAFGAMLYSRFGVSSGTSLVPSAIERPLDESPPREPLIPPGWDPSVVSSRLVNVEQQLDRLRSSIPALPASAAPKEPELEHQLTREQQRLDDYQAELDHRERALEDHANEPIDNSWAGPQVANMQQSLSRTLGAAAQAKNIDCRSKTCTALLTYPSPNDALVSLQQQGQKLSVPGCNGLAAIPTPPTGQGAYDLTVLYTCR